MLIERGKVQSGGIVFEEPLELPDGTEVVVRIEPLAAGAEAAAPLSDEEFLSLPFFGMWADREDMRDSAAWVTRERERWHQRAEDSFRQGWKEAITGETRPVANCGGTSMPSEPLH